MTDLQMDEIDDGERCVLCGEPMGDRTHFIHLEWPRDEPADPGSIEGYQCGECAEAIAIGVLEARFDVLDLGHMYEGLWPDDVEQPPLLPESRP